MVLATRPRNAGSEMLGLYLTDAESRELMRRQELGDRIESVRDALGEPDPVVEGTEPDYGPNFAGVWQDQLDGGAIVVALVDPSLVDRAQLEEIVGGEENLRIIDVDYSWDEIDAYYATLAEAMAARGVPGSVLINATGRGRVFEVFTPDPAAVPSDVLKLVPAELVSLTEGALVAELTNPYNAHSVQDQQPGLRIVTSGGSGCTWGANGHTASYNYIITAGHCGGASYSNYNDWTTSYEIGQAGTVLLTDGSQYLWSIDSGTWDMQRMSSPKGYSNCYHAVAHCIYFVRWRALLNSWEEGSDLVCASLGYSNTWECGYVLQENYNQPSGDCAGNLWVRYDIPAIQGDSGSGLVGPFAYPALSIDSILACGPIGGPFSFGNTAFDVINQLGFDYNCSNSALTSQAAPWWSPCPTYDR